jgi:hypothetical protein
VDEAHRNTWNGTVRVARQAILAILVLLILMAIFLL